MTKYRSEFMQILNERQFIHQCTDESELDNLCLKQIITGYIGFDCTANSLHVGSLVQIMMLRWLQTTGHKPIILIGGGTTKIGDPSGRDESRRLMTDAQISENKKGIKKCFTPFLKFGDGTNDAIFIDNTDWLHALEYVPFLRDIGQHFSLNRMLKFDSVRLRLDREQPMSFLEFNYMILQAYDFLELYRRQNCLLQMGGSDQWGNIVNGIELARRIDSRTLYGITTPLITTASGTKMGKTTEGAVWINKTKLSPYDYWQFWRNTDDRDVAKFLRLFTDLPMDEVRRIELIEGAELNEAKKILANLTTELCHGKQAADFASQTASEVFEKNSDENSGLPEFTIAHTRLQQGIPAIHLIHESGLSKSRGEARRLIRGNGIRFNDILITEEDILITTDHFNDSGAIKISAGKKRHILIIPL